MSKKFGVLLLTATYLLGASAAWPQSSPSVDGSKSATGSVLYTNNSARIVEIGNYTTSGAFLTAPRTLTITKSASCRLVILEDTAEKIVIGCRAELKP